MSMDIPFRWSAPQVVVPEGSRFTTSGAAQAFNDIAGAIAGARESVYRKEQDKLARERQKTLDAIAEDDRQRRIAESDRQKAAYGKIGDAILGASGADVESLRAERARLVAELESLGG